MKIIIDPRCRINYPSYYIKGFWEVYGKKNIEFDVAPFLTEDLMSGRIDYNKCINIIAKEKSIVKKIILDVDDSDEIAERHYNWCDVYAKINVKKNDLENYDKIIPIGPGFGINLVGLSTFLLLLKTFFVKKKPVNNLEYLKNFLYMSVRRKRYNSYVGSISDNDYIFAISTLWYDPLTFRTTNHYRIVFFEICKKIFTKVEGGFFYIEGSEIFKEFPQYLMYKQKFADILHDKRVSAKEYIKKTKRATVVFNTPSVGGCHGWKLGEYFAMGKAIISTPLINEMPDGFENQKNVLIINDEKEMEEKIMNLFINPELREKMEENATKYFQLNLSPGAVVKRIIGKAF